ncbi:hypothetical protein PMAYCL1PPCAC_28996 [Pristionchus mayeri]|uniref:Uncharacterized protein n=1 Tax=Pristionchus mayeri TaxID=1317129 RepID=A0AAN5IDN9_9BILA|nr:hypothetical protein PMAYCL1PPCAC_28996 [Pristionchus mayeri]
MRLAALLFLLFVSLEGKGLSKTCRELLSCAINRGCIKTAFLTARFRASQQISSQMYDDLATAIDYGCIFNSGCNNECNACNLCMQSKLQLTDVLSGESATGDCGTLVSCATECIAKAGAVSEKIVNCLLHGCAFHCFNGSCSKCSRFTTRVFNQACVSGDLRTAINYDGQCHDLFRTIVYAKFKKDFDAIGRQPAIGHL